MATVLSVSSIDFKQHDLDNEFQYLAVSIPLNFPHVVVIELKRPTKRNAIHSEMWKEIGAVFSRLGRLGDGCRCIVLMGRGTAFSAGIDITDPSFFPSQEETVDDDVAHRGLAFYPKILDMQHCFTALEDCPVPVVAAIHGPCIGAGVHLDLACCCDVRLCDHHLEQRFRYEKLRWV